MGNNYTFNRTVSCVLLIFVLLGNAFLTKAQIDAGNIGRVFRAEMAMSPSGNMQKVADFAITGGAMRSTLGITPR